MPSQESVAGWVRLRATGSRVPIVCIHPIGGHVNGYASFAEIAGAEQPVFAIRSRAVRDAASEYESIADMATAYAALVATELSRGAVRLFGWSLGAVVAHAMAGALVESGYHVEVVAMADPVLGAAPKPALSTAAAMALQIFNPVPLTSRGRKRLRALDDGALAPGELHAWCVEHRLLAAETVDPAEFAAAVALLPVHLDLLGDHRPAPCEAPLLVWQAAGFRRADAVGWVELTRARCVEHTLPATHYTMMDRPHLERMVRELRAFAAAPG